MNRLKMHSRRHTGERVVACPICGGMFASNYVYEDHCVRQVSKVQKYKCETCGKFFSSDRILRKHARRHINSFKCTFCDMTFSAPSALAKHIRYCHLNYRPFPCRYCEYSAVSKADIETHLLRHEDLENAKKKNKEIRTYACHCCDDVFPMGSKLTKHLVRVHGYSQATGFPRFRYELSEDGFYRLIPVRYESLEVSNLINASQKNDDLLSSVKNIYENEEQDFKLIQCVAGNSEKPSSFVLLPANIDDKASNQAVKNIQEYSDKHLNYAKNVRSPVKQTAQKVKKKKAFGNGSKKYTRKKVGNKRKGKASTATTPIKANLSKEPVQKIFETKNIEIIIDDVDEDGNVIKTQVMESHEIIV